MIRIERKTAEVIGRVLEDIADIDVRASCSDASFRRHFRMLAESPVAKEAWRKLKEAMNTEEE